MTNVVHLLPAYLAGVVFDLVLVAGRGRQGGRGTPPLAGGGGGVAGASPVDSDVAVQCSTRIKALKHKDNDYLHFCYRHVCTYNKIYVFHDKSTNFLLTAEQSENSQVKLLCSGSGMGDPVSIICKKTSI